jgi:hypothetical protein
METRRLPDVLGALTDHLFDRGDKKHLITEGWNNDTPVMQTAYPLEKRLHQEREHYHHRVYTLLQSAITSGALIVRDYSGAPIDGVMVFGPKSTGLALCVKLENLQTWLNDWMIPSEVTLFMRKLGSTPTHAPAKSKPGPAKSAMYDEGIRIAPQLMQRMEDAYENDPRQPLPTLGALAVELARRFPGTSEKSWEKKKLTKLMLSQRNVTSYNP